MQVKLDVSGPSALSYTWISSYMPEQHREFYAQNLPFVPITTLDADGRPWSSIVASATGKRGFIKSPGETRLRINVRMWEGDPLINNLKLVGHENVLLAGLGIDFSNRRRNKFAGHVTSVQYVGPLDARIDVEVNQALG